MMQLIDLEQTSKIPSLLLAYAGSALVLVILGSVAVWYSAEDNIRKMFVIGLSAPALLAAGLPPSSSPTVMQGAGAKAGGLIMEQIIPSAYAQAGSPECVGDSAFSKGLKLFWGWRDNIAGYNVVAGSYRDPAQAAAKAAAINAEDPSMKARVGVRRCDNDYYPVIVGDVVGSVQQAKKTAAKAENLDSVQDAYVSPVPLR